jgi:TPR repeat protein
MDLSQAYASLLEGNRDAIPHLLREANAGNIDAMLYLGWAYSNGAEQDRNYDAAKDWLQRAESLGSVEAPYRLAKLYERTGEHELFEQILRKSTAQRFSPCYYLLGASLLDRGNQEGLHFLHEASSLGHVFAKQRLAREYFSGRQGVAAIGRGALIKLHGFLSLLRHGTKYETDPNFWT